MLTGSTEKGNSMKIFPTFLTAAAMTLASTAAYADKSAVQTFEHDGVTYEYTTTEMNGKTIIRGSANGGAPFRLVVTETKVRGTVGRQHVSFPRPKSRTIEVAAIAAR